MRAGLIVVALACVPLTNASAEERRPLVVELFTSQGCSSCPPADALVADLARRRPDILPLTFHVTYWNSLGWQDPFAFQGATDRQSRYVSLAVSPAVYTPALVVEGRRTVIGSDAAAVGTALAGAAADERTVAALIVERRGREVTIAVGAGEGRGTVLLVGYDREHETAVGRGENTGRTLREANVVRSIVPAGSWSGTALTLHVDAPPGEELAVIVQADDGRIVGAARSPAP